MAPDVTVRPFASSDRAAWDPLWAGYLRFYRTAVDPVVADATFARLVAREQGMAGLAAVAPGGELLGFAHVVEHADTWATSNTLYLNDLFVNPELRGGGVGRALIDAVYAEAQARGCHKAYWITEEFNWVARRTYETVAQRKSYLWYEHATA